MTIKLITITLLSILHHVKGRVDIFVHQPYYVEYGSNLTLRCVSDNGRQLEWIQETPDTGWKLEVINPVIGGNYITRYMIEKPSNDVESTLIKLGMVLDDRGMYECRDSTQENSFALWTTVIYIATTDVQAIPQTSVDLYCSIQGFDSNIPYVDYHWYYQEETIISNHKYDVVYRDGVLQLTIDQPVYEDAGNYTCSFVLQTNQEPVIFSKDVYLDTTKLETSSASSYSYTLSWRAALLLVITTHILISPLIIV